MSNSAQYILTKRFSDGFYYVTGIQKGCTFGSDGSVTRTEVIEYSCSVLDAQRFPVSSNPEMLAGEFDLDAHLVEHFEPLIRAEKDGK